MKKVILAVLTFVALGLTSCQENEVVDSQSSMRVPVTFNIAMQSDNLMVGAAQRNSVSRQKSNAYYKENSVAPENIGEIHIVNYYGPRGEVVNDKIYNFYRGDIANTPDLKEIQMDCRLGENRFYAEAVTSNKAQLDFIDAKDLYTHTATSVSLNSNILYKKFTYASQVQEISMASNNNISLGMIPENSILELVAPSENEYLRVKLSVKIGEVIYVAHASHMMLNTGDLVDKSTMMYKIEVEQKLSGVWTSVKTYISAPSTDADGWFSKSVVGNKHYKLNLPLTNDNFSPATGFTILWNTNMDVVDLSVPVLNL